MTAIASLLTNAFKTVQPSAKDKEDTYRRADEMCIRDRSLSAAYAVQTVHIQIINNATDIKPINIVFCCFFIMFFIFIIVSLFVCDYFAVFSASLAVVESKFKV